VLVAVELLNWPEIARAPVDVALAILGAKKRSEVGALRRLHPQCFRDEPDDSWPVPFSGVLDVVVSQVGDESASEDWTLALDDLGIPVLVIWTNDGGPPDSHELHREGDPEWEMIPADVKARLQQSEWRNPFLVEYRGISCALAVKPFEDNFYISPTRLVPACCIDFTR
jgi:hypothetical protein